MFSRQASLNVHNPPTRPAWRYLVFAALLAGALAACSGAGVNTPPGTPADVAGQVNLFATQTAMAEAAAPPFAPAASPTLPPPSATPSLQPTLTDTPTPTPDRAGPFRQVSPAEALIAGRALGIAFDSQGRLWLLSEHGFSLFEAGKWTGYLADFKGTLAGMDGAGRFWFVSPDGTLISAWDGAQWVDYGPEAGWETLADPFSPPAADGLLAAPDDGLWLATSQDVRRFDGQRWTVYEPAAMQMVPPQDPDAFLEFHLVALPDRDEIWVGRCDWIGPGPQGGSLVKFSAGTWQSIAPNLAAGCISALAVDPSAGSLWAGQDGELRRYDLAAGDWEAIPLPTPPEDGLRIGYFTQLTSSPDGALWAEMGLCGGASCYLGELLYQRRAETWGQIGETSEGLSRRLLFGGEGQTWLVAGERIFEVRDGQTQPVAELNVLASATDETGGVWLVAAGAGPPTLWTLAER